MGLRRFRAVMSCAFICAAAVLISGAPAVAGLAAVWAVDDGEKIFQDDLSTPLQSPGPGNSVWDGSKVSLFGAANEVVAFQLILQSDASGAAGVNVVVSDLTNPDGGTGGDFVPSITTIPGSLPLPAPNDYVGVGVELFTEHYLHVTTPSWNDPVYGGFYWTAEANPHITGWIPDALVPFSAAAGKGGAPFDIAPSLNQGVWADIYVPRLAAPGIFTGTITVSVGVSTVAEIPIELDVLPFALPDENHYKTMVFISRENVVARHNIGCCTPEMWAMLEQYHRMAHRHRFDLIGSGDWEEINNLGGVLSGDSYLQTAGYGGPGEGVGNQVFSVHTYGWSFGETEAEYQAESDAWVNWFDANAPGLDYFLYLIDEPGPDMYDWVRQRASWIHDNPGPGHRLPVFMTRAPLDDLIGSIDVWSCQAPSYDPVRVAEANARGEQVQLYAGNRPQTPADMIDEYGIAFRLKPWIGHMIGVSRWFTWESTHWNGNGNEAEPYVDKNVWVNPVTFTTGTPDGTGNGDGTLFYPGEDASFPEESRGYPGPIASIRMKMYRRGIQDAEYMWLAEQAGHASQVQQLLTDTLPEVMWNAPAVPTWSNTNADYEAVRRQLANLIVGVPQSFPDVPSDHWAYDEIMACAGAGIVQGYLDGLYRPANPVSRDQMAVFISRALARGEDNVPPGPTQPTFPDVPTDFWAYDHVEYAAANNVVEGYGDGSYQPAWTVTRSQMAVFIARGIATPTGEAGLADYTPPETPTFSDVPSSYWSYKHIEYLAAPGIVTGYLDGTFQPTWDVTRDQMAVYIAKAFLAGGGPGPQPASAGPQP
jgi:hypothetical protein